MQFTLKNWVMIGVIMLAESIGLTKLTQYLKNYADNLKIMY